MNRKLTVLMIDKYYFIKGGAERYFFELKNTLESQGHKVIPFSMKHPDNFQTEYENYFVNNVEFNHRSKIKKIIDGPGIAGRIIYSISAKKKIEKLIKDVKPDIAHLHMIDHQISPSILHVLKKYGVPTIQTVHQYKLVCPNYRLFNNNKNNIYEKCLGGNYFYPIIENCHKTYFSAMLLSIEMYIHKLLKIYEKNVDLFHTPSNFMQQKLIEGGIDQNQITKLYYTIDLNEFPVSPDYEDYFVYFGRLSEEKGVLTLLQAMKKIKQSQLKIVGDGPLKNSLEQFAKENNLKNVEFVGYKDGDELKSIMGKTKFVVVPSEWYDNSPLVIYESFSMGKPVIGADIGGITELVDHQKNGLLIQHGKVEDLREAIIFLLNSSDTLKKFGENARKKAELQFNPSIHYEKIMDMYSKLISA